MSIVFVVSGPSGTGKSTLVEKLMASGEGLEFAVSVTTRPRRSTEEEGKSYSFVSKEEFLRMRERGAFIEWAEVFGHFYGTPWSAVERPRASDRDVLLDIDVQGASLLGKRFPDAVKVFVLPPSKGKLEQRLRDRSADGTEEIRRRLGEASREIAHYGSYDYILVNEEVADTVARLRAILTAERSKTANMKAGTGDILKSFGVEPDKGAGETE